MERILIKQDDEKLDIILDSFYNIYHKSLKNVSTKYEALNLGKFNQDVLNDIKANDCRNIKDRYDTELNKQLDANKVTFPALRKQLFEGSLQPIRDFEQAFNELQLVIKDNRGNPYKFEYISYDDEEEYFLRYTDEAEEEILENHCRYYTESDKESKMYTASQKFLEAYLEMEQAVKETETEGIFRINTFGHLGLLDLSKILTRENDVTKVSPDVIERIRIDERNKRYYADIAAENTAKRKKEQERIDSIDWLDLSDPNWSGKYQHATDKSRHENESTMKNDY